MKNKVRTYLISKGNNVEDVNNMIEANFDFAITKYNTVVKIANYLRAVY